jgi:methyltransferase-like protein
MAYSLPNATFVGVDGSLVQIERGKESIAITETSNLQLIHGDLLEIDSEYGSFDYIICHGVYSWVPPHVRTHILQISEQLLTENGIAYISYNALPGWHMYSMLRNMMRYHVRRIPDDENKIEQSIAMLQFVGQNLVDPYDSYGSFIRENMDHLSRSTSEYVFHEYLEENNQAFYFHEFIESLTPHNLQYLGDTDFNTMNNLHFPEQTQETLNDISGNIYELEQYMDILRNRRFRCDLVTHDNLDLSREVTLDPFTQAYFTLSILHNQEGNLSAEDVVLDILNNTFIENHHQNIAEIPSFAQTIWTLFHSWPKYIHFSDLCTTVEEKIHKTLSDQERVEIAALLQTLLLRNIVDIHLFQPQIADSVSTYPCASPVARAQIRYQMSISNQHHTMIALKDKWMRILLPHIDGSKSKEDLSTIMHTDLKDDPILFPDGTDECMEKLEQFLQILHQKGVLVS